MDPLLLATTSSWLVTKYLYLNNKKNNNHSTTLVDKDNIEKFKKTRRKYNKKWHEPIKKHRLIKNF
jgi:hypothetical protein